MSDTKTGMRPPRSLILATPTGLYVLITGPAAYGLSIAQTGAAAGGAFAVLLFLPAIGTAAGTAAKAAVKRAFTRKPHKSRKDHAK